MKKSTIGALLLLLLGVAGVLAWKFIKPKLAEKHQLSTSDASKITETVRVAGDNYLGYWFVGSPEMRQQCLQNGIGVEFTEDNGDYAGRLEKFSSGQYDAIVLPVSSYLQHGAKHKFPGVIVASICESRGADGIVVFTDQVKDMNVNNLNNPNLRFVYTGGSPSEFLLDLTIADFGLDQLTAGNGKWRIEVDGSKQVYDKARKRDGNVFVLWEPDLSKALELKDAKCIWSSDKFSGYIVDVLVFRREILEKRPQTVFNFLKHYFRTVELYANNRQRMIEEMNQSTGLKKDVVEANLKKIEWFGLQENARRQFGVSDSTGGNAVDGVINTILACTKVLVRAGRLDHDPLEGKPYLITNSTVIQELVKTNAVFATSKGGESLIKFDALDDETWKKLKEIGTMRVEPIYFQSGSSLLNDTGKEQVNQVASLLINNYPTYRIIVRGHTPKGGDEQDNLALSLERAQAVAQYLTVTHNLDLNRLRVEGMGSKYPLLQLPDESVRSYRDRSKRVEFILLENKRF